MQKIIHNKPGRGIDFHKQIGMYFSGLPSHPRLPPPSLLPPPPSFFFLCGHCFFRFASPSTRRITIYLFHFIMCPSAVAVLDFTNPIARNPLRKCKEIIHSIIIIHVLIPEPNIQITLYYIKQHLYNYMYLYDGCDRE